MALTDSILQTHTQTADWYVAAHIELATSTNYVTIIAGDSIQRGLWVDEWNGANKESSQKAPFATSSSSAASSSCVPTYNRLPN